jgi:hypothetical protein
MNTLRLRFQDARSGLRMDATSKAMVLSGTFAMRSARWTLPATCTAAAMGTGQ